MSWKIGFDDQRCSALMAMTIAAGVVLGSGTTRAQDWPELPAMDAAVEIPVQEWPLRPGPRSARILIHYPGGALAQVSPQTGLMLTLHNWGGTDCAGTADPRQLAQRLDVIAVCVNYLQSGRQEGVDAAEPYDFGYLQALDALRALWYVRDQLKTRKIAFADDRIYCTGGSGGGNVTLMANKLAPRTFACVVDMCGMKKLSDDIAFHVPGGSSLNARWSRDPQSPHHLSIDAQELRFVGHPGHLAEMLRLKSDCRIITVHGVEDITCPWADAVEMVDLMRQAGIKVQPMFITPADLDATIFTSAGHALGNRTRIVVDVFRDYLAVNGRHAERRPGPTDFDRREDIRYATTHGEFVISYAEGYPVGRFESSPPPVSYSHHDDLLYWQNADGQRQAVKSPDDWEIRRQHILRNLQLVMGPLPSPLSRVPLQVQVTEEVRLDPPMVAQPLIRRKLSWQSDPAGRVPAWLFLPVRPPGTSNDVQEKLPAVLCLQQTADAGKDEPAGIRGDPSMKYALELAEQGFVTLAPDYPSFGDHAWDFSARPEYSSGSMKAIWDNIRAVDVLESLPEVDPQRMGVLGHSLGGHNAIFTSVFEPRLRVIVSSCGFTSLQKDDIPSWTGPRYMPRLATLFDSQPSRVPFDFHELIACLAPRPFLACAATQDSDFDVSGVRDVMQSASTVYALYGQPDALQSVYPAAEHSFPDTSRQQAYEFLARHLGHSASATRKPQPSPPDQK